MALSWVTGNIYSDAKIAREAVSNFWRLDAEVKSLPEASRPDWFVSLAGETYARLREQLETFPDVSKFESVAEATETVDRVLEAYSIRADHCWGEISAEIYDMYPALSDWLREAGTRWLVLLESNDDGREMIDDESAMRP